MSDTKTVPTYQWPPRPTTEIRPLQFEFFYRRGFTMTQYKMNGTCAVIGLGPENRLEMSNRNNEELNWAMPPEQHAALRRLLAATDSPYWTIVVAELLHSKVKVGPKNTIYLHDVLMFAGASMVGVRYFDRIGLLYERALPTAHRGYTYPDEMRSLSPLKSGVYEVTPTIWVAANLDCSPAQAFKAAAPGTGIREGIVMKNPDAVLEPCINETANSKTLGVKCRYGTKNW